jgi:hypothetical protein
MKSIEKEKILPKQKPKEIKIEIKKTDERIDLVTIKEFKNLMVTYSLFMFWEK